MAYRIVGLTHTPDGKALIRTPRSTKVGIGVPKGKDIYAFVDNNGKFAIATNHGKDVARFDTIEQAREKYREKLKTAEDRKYPAKLPYFIFTKLTATGWFEPDWEAMAKHGPTPTEIDIIFLHDDPFDARLEMWATTGLQCSGDGINAQRILSLAETAEERKAADQAKREGLKTFPILNGCREHGCRFAQGDSPLCKPHGQLRFQLLSRPTLGGNAQFDTTGFRSVANIASCLEEMKGFTNGRVAGIPLKLVLRPHTVAVFDKKKNMKVSSIAYNVSVEFRTEQAEQLKQVLIESANKWATSGGSEYPQALPDSRSLPAPELPPDEDNFDEPTGFSEAQTAQMMEAEFYPTPGDGEEDTAPEYPVDDGDTFEDHSTDELPPDDEDFSEPGEPNIDRTVQVKTEDAVEGLLSQLQQANQAKKEAEEAKRLAAEAAAQATATPKVDDPPPFEITDDDLPPILANPEPEPEPAPEPPKPRAAATRKATPALAPAPTPAPAAAPKPAAGRNLFGNNGDWD